MSKKEELNDVITAAADSAQSSVESYTQFAKEANEQLNGATPAETGAWLNLGAKAYARAATDAATMWATGFQVLGILSKDED